MSTHLETILDTSGITLSQALASLGWTHTRTEQSHGQGRDVYMADGTYAGTYDAFKMWEIIRDMQTVPFYERTLASFVDGIITRARQSTDNGLWYAALDVGPKRYVSDPDFATCAKSREEAVTKCARKIREDAKEIGKFAPHSIIIQGKYDFSWRLAKHWADKETAATIARKGEAGKID